MSETAEPRIVVIGLGYVGLPLAVALAKRFAVVGLDRDVGRIEELKRGDDRTGEVTAEALGAVAGRLALTADPAEGAGADLYILTVPTPVDDANRPDLNPLVEAARTVGGLIDPRLRPTVVVESTVFPGCTEQVVGPAIAAAGGLMRGRDFRLGYSPERINPGDRVHSIDKIVKVVAGEDREVLEQLARVYGAVTGAGVFRAASIRAAEAAKAIENAQRDINIAFMNEVAQIVGALGISVWDVIDAAATKWNFLPFQPGLVGGHCIGVDPYYLAHAAAEAGHDPRVVLAGRGINDGMAGWIAERLHERRGGKAGRVLILGLTFKEDVPDLRNSKVAALALRLADLGHQVRVADPLADAAAADWEYGLELGEMDGRHDLVIGAVAHRAFREMAAGDVEALVAPGGTLADIKGMWRGLALDPAIDRWML